MDTAEQDPYVRLISTTRWVQETKMSPAPKAKRHSGRRPSRWSWLSPRNPREPLNIRIRFRAGSECYWEVSARGQVGYFAGHTSIHDAFVEIMQGSGHYPRC